jgi:hypothetical protein
VELNCKVAKIAGDLRSAVSETLAEQADYFVRIASLARMDGLGATRQARFADWRMLCTSLRLSRTKG